MRHTLTRITLLALLLLAATAGAQAQTDIYRRYIDRYSEMAVDQMRRYGVPASITLGQGLLESAAGQSRLAREANNHFGIKVGGSWTGPYIVMADDRPDDRFRVYRSVEASYEDHSQFLRNNKRYASLFDLSPTDYRGWATGLKRAGYATSPTYAQNLISIIERYGLQEYDKQKQRTSRSQSRQMRYEIRIRRQAGNHTISRCNGQYYVVAMEGDTYASLARRFDTRERKLRSYNDVDKTYRLKAGDIVYLGKKKKRADKKLGKKYHILRSGESLYDISQRYGIRLSSLCKKNPIGTYDYFEVGDKIRIR